MLETSIIKQSKEDEKDDDNDSFAQYDLNTENKSPRSKEISTPAIVRPSNNSSPSISEMTEIITLK